MTGTYDAIGWHNRCYCPINLHLLIREATVVGFLSSKAKLFTGAL